MGTRRRGVAVLLAGTAVLFGSCVQLVGMSRSAWHDVRLTAADMWWADPAALQGLAGALAASGAAAVCGWLLIGVVLTVLAGAPTSARSRRHSWRAWLEHGSRAITPTVVRHSVAAALGVTLATGLPAPAAAAATAPVASTVASTVSTVAPASAVLPDLDPRWYGALGAVTLKADLRPGWVPTKPEPRHRATPTPGLSAAGPTVPLAGGPRRPRLDAAEPDEVVVRKGDTLWSLAARRLGRDASDAQIALEWPTWFEANRSRVGPDPDRLLPGTRLVVPEAPSTGGRP